MQDSPSTPIPLDITPDLGNYLAGFADGEGCFQIVPSSKATGFIFSFAIFLRCDDKAVLEMLCEKTGLGRVYDQASSRGNDNARWVIYTKADCLKLVALFEAYPLRAKKRRDFVIWAEGVRAWAQRRYGEDWGTIAALRHDLISGRAFVQPETKAVENIA